MNEAETILMLAFWVVGLVVAALFEDYLDKKRGE